MHDMNSDSSDEDFEFYVAPKHAVFSSEKGGASRHLMVNGTDHRIAVKVKCSNNVLYRVSPVYTCLDPGKAKRLQVLRNPGNAEKDKLILLYKPTQCSNAKTAFQTNSIIGNVNETLQYREKKKLIKLFTRTSSIINLVANQNEISTMPINSEDIQMIDSP